MYMCVEKQEEEGGPATHGIMNVCVPMCVCVRVCVEKQEGGRGGAC